MLGRVPDGQKGPGGTRPGYPVFGSFIVGTLSVLALMLVAPPLAKFALAFGPREYFGLTLLGVLILIYLASSSILKALMMAVFGLLLGTIGRWTPSQGPSALLSG